MPIRLALSPLVITAVLCSAAFAENWPGWRGPNRDGHSGEENLPTEWTDADIAWKAPLPGWGQSSPVVWEDRIFLTAYEDKKLLTICLDRETGRVLWRTRQILRPVDRDAWAWCSVGRRPSRAVLLSDGDVLGVGVSVAARELRDSGHGGPPV